MSRESRNNLVRDSPRIQKSVAPPHRSDFEDLHTTDTIEKFPFILLNVIMILNSATTRIYSTLMDQFLYQRFANDILGNSTENTASKPCVNETNSTKHSALLSIQDMTSQMSLYLSLADYGISLLPCVLLGGYSALIGRKVLLLIPMLVAMVKAVVIAAVIYWTLDVNWLYLGYIVSGLGGGASGIFLGIFLYMADITSRSRKRTTFMSFLEGGKGFVSGILYYATGQLIESTGFNIPAIMAAGFNAFTLGILVLLPEKKTKEVTSTDKRDWSIKACCQRLSQPFNQKQHPQVRKMVVLALVAFLIIIVAVSGQSKIRNLYLMNLPFCWDAVSIGWFLSAQDITYNLFTMFAVPLFYRCLPGMGLALFGVTSLLSGMVMFALANSDLDIYLIIGLSVGGNVAFGLIRGETSRLLDDGSQGSLFASLGVFEAISILFGTPTLSLYQATISYYSGFTFLVLVGVLLAALAILSAYQVIWIRYTREVKSKELHINKYGSINS